MRSLTLGLVAMLFMLFPAQGAKAQEDHVFVRETSDTRLTADIFVEASFPEDIIYAARMADMIAARTEQKRQVAQQYLIRIELAYDSSLFSKNFPMDIFIQIHEKYEEALHELWKIDKELIAADDEVNSRYFIWTSGGEMSKEVALAYQRWFDASRADYISVSEESRLMRNIGRDKIRKAQHKLRTFSIRRREQ